MSLEFERKLTVPAETKKMYPRTSEMAEIFNRRDAEIKDIFSGKNKTRTTLKLVHPNSG